MLLLGLTITLAICAICAAIMYAAVVAGRREDEADELYLGDFPRIPEPLAATPGSTSRDAKSISGVPALSTRQGQRTGSSALAGRKDHHSALNKLSHGGSKQ